ncbi:PepSY domain-containing protein [Riemerella columbina]|uniref:PepSY domain-containing protein n=1 Tax=Riemerella columbina TaxID=103810 RepID=UPI00037A2EDF|nr:PepSY domain-containing protein [Riemerella columbina]
MRTSLWRSVHLILAVLVSAFLLIASVTGGILAFNKVVEQTSTPYKISSTSLAELIPKVQSHIAEISELEVEHHQLIVKGFDENMEEIHAVVNPEKGDLVGEPQKESDFIKSVTTLHRSLFLHETGRLIVGVVSVLFLLSLVTGFVLLYRRQGNRLLSNPELNKKSDFIHFLGGKWFMIPLLIIAITGSILFLYRLDLLKDKNEKTIPQTSKATKQLSVAQFPIFKSTTIKEIKKLTFPMFEDEEEFFELTTHREKLKINQFTGEVVSKQPFSSLKILESLNKDLHTGDINGAWALVLMLSAIMIPLLIGSGIFLWWNRRPKKIKNKHKPEEAEYIILVGSESGSTWQFAQKIFQQILNTKATCYIGTLNEYQQFNKATHLLIFASTYGEGEAPSNADKAIELISKIPQQQTIQYSILGFGSKLYPDFCAFAEQLEQALSRENWATPILPLYTVNDRSLEDISHWAKAWNEVSALTFMTSPTYYTFDIPNLNRFQVIEQSALDEDNQIFSLVLKPLSKLQFQSGDILAIYPEQNHKERLYSIGKVDQHIHLLIKLHENGLGSQYLKQLTKGQKIKARIVENPSFHFPQHASEVLMIANGTGVAPFLGMMRRNTPHIKKTLWAGFRYDTARTQDITKQAHALKLKNQLEDYKIVYSKGEQPMYVTHWVQQQSHNIATLLQSNGVLMLCGSLAMQKGVEQALEQICKAYQLKPLSYYKHQHQILTDCY